MRLLHIFSTAVNAVLPLVLLIMLGYWLRRVGFFTDSFVRVGNKFVFRVCLSSSLFVNVYNIQALSEIPWSFVIFIMLSALFLFVVGMIVAVATTKVEKRRGVILQAVFRGNFAIIGLPLAGALGGDAATEIASVAAAFILPLWNALGVIALSMYSERRESFFRNALRVVKSIVRNPIIIGAAIGLVCLILRELQRIVLGTVAFTIKQDIPFVYTVINNLKTISSPLALIILGAQFTFSAVRGMFKEIAVCTVGRIVLAPILGIGAAYLLSTHTNLLSCGVNEYPTLIGLLGSPAAVSGAVMAGEMGNDEQLATQTVVWTSICSIVTVFVTVCVLMLAGLLPV
jgi:predicted permease